MTSGTPEADPPGSARWRWRRALAEWAIPEAILSAAPESPWAFPPEIFATFAREALDSPLTPTHLQVAEVLPDDGVLLDVGSGAGAASLPVAPAGGRLVAVDQDRHMLQAMADLGGGAVPLVGIEGRWPEVAEQVRQVGQVDVAVCANVAYNVGDLGPFVEALTSVASRRVVLELSATHPQSPLNPLWLEFWGVERPSGPTADDAAALVTEVLDVEPGSVRWKRTRSFLGERGPGTVSWIRRRLCLTPDRDAEVAAALERLGDLAPLEAVTLWWPGRAPEALSGGP